MQTNTNGNNPTYTGGGVFVRPPDPRDHRLDVTRAGAAVGAHKQEHLLPAWSARIRDQAGAQSCVAQALSGIGGMYEGVEMSTDYIYGNAREDGPNGPGLYAQDGLDFLVKRGNVTETDMPGNTETPAVIVKVQGAPAALREIAMLHRAEGYAYLCGNNGPKRDDEAVLTALDLGYPVFTVVRDGGMLETTRKQGADTLCDMIAKRDMGSHAIVIIGYKYIGGKLYWRVRNSWGTSWGDGGCAWCVAGDNTTWAHMWAVHDSMQFIDKPTVHAVLRRGDKGAEVVKLQTALVAHGLQLGIIDGSFGPKTENAVMDFQRAHYITVNGIVDSTTWALLEKTPGNIPEPVDPAPIEPGPVSPDPTQPDPGAWTYPAKPMARVYGPADRSKRISKYFTVSDLWLDASHSTITLHDNLLRALDTIIDHYGADRLEWYSKNSIFRTEASNIAAGGATNSQHRYGTAADFWVIKNGKRLDMEEVAAWVEENLDYVHGIGIYKGTHMHIDVRTGAMQYWWIVTTASNTPGFGGKPCVFKSGSRSPAVRKIQKWLNDNGYRNDAGKSLTTDGVYGANTAQAVKKAQRALGASVDGAYGPGTNGKTKIFPWN